MSQSNAMKTQVIKLSVDSKSKSQNSDSKKRKSVTPIASNLSPASKKLLGGASKAQLIALAASVPLFSALGYGAAKSDIFAAESLNSGAAANTGGDSRSGAVDSVLSDEPIATGVDPMLSNDATDEMTFVEAFLAARHELGSGHYFIWHGNAYSTNSKEQWESLSDDEKADIIGSIPVDDLPDFISSEGLTPVLVQTDENLEPETLVVEDNSVLQFNEQGEPTLNDEQIEIIVEHDINGMTDSEKMDMLLKTYGNEEAIVSDPVVEPIPEVEYAGTWEDSTSIIEPAVDGGIEEGCFPTDENTGETGGDIYAEDVQTTFPVDENTGEIGGGYA